MKNLFISIIFVVLGCQIQNSQTKSMVDNVAELCSCQNSEGKTIETHAREVLGQDFYLTVNSVDDFSDKLKSNPDKFELLTQTIENQFLRDEKYKNCAKQSLKNISGDMKQGTTKNEATVLKFFNEKKEFTVYRILPFLITYLEQNE